MERNQAGAQYRSFVGEQADIIILSVPAGAAQSLVGQNLRGAVLTVDGTYLCSISVNGMKSQIEMHVTATLSGTAAVTTDAYMTFNDETTKKGASFTGVGALVSATRQDITFNAPRGERRAILSLAVVHGTGAATFTQAEYNGL